MLDKIELSIANSFTTIPGARYYSDGKYSGEEFREEVFIPAYNTAKEQNKILLVDLDGCAGYASSFLEEAFGGLARIYGSEDVLKNLEIRYNDEPDKIEKIHNYITNAKKA